MVLTWNVNQKLQPKSAQAPADDRMWSASDNLDAIQAEVLRWRPDVLSVQECAGRCAAARFVAEYDLLGAQRGHAAEAGFVQLYAKKSLHATALSVSEVPGVMAPAQVRGTKVVFLAM